MRDFRREKAAATSTAAILTSIPPARATSRATNNAGNSPQTPRIAAAASSHSSSPPSNFWSNTRIHRIHTSHHSRSTSASGVRDTSARLSPAQQHPLHHSLLAKHPSSSVSVKGEENSELKPPPKRSSPPSTTQPLEPPYSFPIRHVELPPRPSTSAGTSTPYSYFNSNSHQNLLASNSPHSSSLFSRKRSNPNSKPDISSDHYHSHIRTASAVALHFTSPESRGAHVVAGTNQATAATARIVPVTPPTSNQRRKKVPGSDPTGVSRKAAVPREEKEVPATAPPSASASQLRLRTESTGRRNRIISIAPVLPALDLGIGESTEEFLKLVDFETEKHKEAKKGGPAAEESEQVVKASEQLQSAVSAVKPLELTSLRSGRFEEVQARLLERPKRSDSLAVHHQSPPDSQHSQSAAGEPPPQQSENPQTRARSKSTSKTMLASALQRANTAVTLDNAENYEGAMEAYTDACLLLGQVMVRTNTEEDRKRLRAIKDTYTQRIIELRGMPLPAPTGRALPPRPRDDDYEEDDEYVEEDDATLYDYASTIGHNNVPIYPESSSTLAPPWIPPRRDSMMVDSDDPHGTTGLSLVRSQSSEIIPPPLSPRRQDHNNDHRHHNQSSPKSRPDTADSQGQRFISTQIIVDNRSSFTFGAAALSPTFSPTKAAHYGVMRTMSNGSNGSSRESFRVNQASHSRNISEEPSTSWFAAVDESGSSTGEPSPKGWIHGHRSVDGDEALLQQAQDVEGLIDEVVEAAWGEGLVVDHSFNQPEPELVGRTSLDKINQAKEEVRREFAEHIRQEDERRLQEEQQERELRGYFKSRDARDSYLEGTVPGDESDDERLMDEMSNGIDYDSFDFGDFGAGMKTALPRESSSTTTYSEKFSERGSINSSYSSVLGTTWGSSRSGHLSGKALQTVAESPATPPPALPLPAVPTDKSRADGVPGLQSPNKASAPPLPSVPPSPTKSTEDSRASTPGSIIGGKTEVRNKRLSALSESLEPLKIAPPHVSATTILQDLPAPLPPPMGPPPPPPTTLPPPIPKDGPVHPLNIPPKSPLPPLPASRPTTAHGNHPGSPTTADDGDLEITEIRPKLSSPPPVTSPEPFHGGFSTMPPLTKTLSNDTLSAMPRPDSPATAKPPSGKSSISSIPGLRQIHSSASLRNASRNLPTPEPTDLPPTPNLFASTSMTNLRKPVPNRSATPSTPSGFPTTPSLPPQMGSLGLNLFDSTNITLNPSASTSTDHLPDSVIHDPMAPYPLEPCPLDPIAKPFWLMRALYQTVTHARGGFISTRLFVPRDVWYIKGVKLKGVDDKISACDLVTAALGKLATVDQNNVTAIHDEMQALEGVLDRAQQMLSKKLGSDVGAAGAAAAYGITPGENSDMFEKKPGPSTGGKSYFSIRKLRSKTASGAAAAAAAATAASGGGGGGAQMRGETGESTIPMVTGDEKPVQARRDLASVSFGGPLGTYIAALARLFDAAQILDQLQVFNDEDMVVMRAGKKDKAPAHVKVGLELSHRHAAEFFGFYICRFVLADIAVLLDKFVKRGSEWAAQ